MQIIELYIKGYKRFQGSNTSVTANKLVDGGALFTTSAEVGDYVENLNDGSTAKITAIDSDTQLSISADIFTTTNVGYEITSEYFRADMFDDESVVITDSILNVRDIAKVFTPFSKEFNLPASKLNNKLFRHYENTDVLDSFDARYRHDAIIKLNGIDYKKGKIQFRNVKLKNNKAYSYKVTFFGEAVDLKTILADTTLGGLDYGDLDFTYEDTEIDVRLTQTKAWLEANRGTSDIVVPNIHHSKNMRFTDDGYRDAITGTKLTWTDFKPAIRLSAIIQAVTRTFPQLQFGPEFLYSQDFQQPYMWCHRNEGYLTNAEEGGEIQIIRNRWKAGVDDYTFIDSDPVSIGDRRGSTTQVYGSSWFFHRWKFQVTVTATDPNEPFDIRILKGATEEQLESVENVSGSWNLWAYVNSQDMNELDFIVEVTSASTLSMTQNVFLAKEYRVSWWSTTWTEQWRCNYTAVSADTQNTFFVGKHMPDMKVMDFLSGLFKMFNLVVYKKGGIITIQTASAFNNAGENYDITKYVDMESAVMERLFQYKRMDFKFKGKNSFLVQYADEINGVPFAEENYGNDRWDGGVYNLEVPFEKMMYERLSNETDGTLSDIGQGAMLNKKFEPTIGEPLIFIPIHTDGNGDWESSSTEEETYYRPSNVTTFDWGWSRRLQINFGEEIDEWLQEVPSSSNTVNLFSYQYQDYVEGVFRRNARMLKVTAYLPISIITKYELNDKFIINNKTYRINSVKTNLLTNKTDLELYNIDEFATQIENGQVAWAGRLASLTISNVFKSEFVVSWSLLSDPTITNYDVYLNGGLYNSNGNTTTSQLVDGLDANTNYNVSVRVKYSGGYYSFDTAESVTTNNITPP